MVKVFRNDVCGLVLILLILMICCMSYGENESPHAPVFDIQFHRGGRDARPENTLYAFQYAIEHGAATIECDMQMTRDKVIVLAHNPALNPDLTMDAEGNWVGDELFINRMNWYMNTSTSGRPFRFPNA